MVAANARLEWKDADGGARPAWTAGIPHARAELDYAVLDLMKAAEKLHRAAMLG